MSRAPVAAYGAPAAADATIAVSVTIRRVEVAWKVL